jgi:hypothetical protein
MPKTIFDAAARRQLLARIDRLTPDAPARWGKFTAQKMLLHLADSARMALGDLPIKRRKSILSFPPLRYLVLHVAPFPRGAPTAPQLLLGESAGWAQDVAQLKALIERAAAQSIGGHWQPHPVFGVMSDNDWGTLIYRHTDHHLKQFGV